MSSIVDQIYLKVRTMAANFEFKPAERINESILSKNLGVSRTPLREALNRLVAEGLLSFKNGSGFFCRSLEPNQIVDLYELREAVEAEAIIRTIERASEDEINQLGLSPALISHSYDNNISAKDIVALDEKFHLQIAKLSQNSELVRLLENINQRIRYVRWISIKKKMNVTHDAHLGIYNAISKRNQQASVTLIRAHIHKNNKEATETIRAAFSQLYVPNIEHIFSN